MSKADKLLRELVAASDYDRKGSSATKANNRLRSAWSAARAYLNEKPQPIAGQDLCKSPATGTGAPASPPHAERCEHGVRWQDSCRACAHAEPVGQPDTRAIVADLCKLSDEVAQINGKYGLRYGILHRVAAEVAACATRLEAALNASPSAQPIAGKCSSCGAFLCSNSGCPNASIDQRATEQPSVCAVHDPGR